MCVRMRVCVYAYFHKEREKKKRKLSIDFIWSENVHIFPYPELTYPYLTENK